MRYAARVLDQDRFSELVLDAIDVNDASAQINARGMVLADLRVLEGRAGSSAEAGRFDLALFAAELAELLDAGLALAEAIDVLAERDEQPDSARISAVLRARLHEGLRFSDALAAAGPMFPPLFVGLIRASEQTSGVVSALHRYLEYRQRFDALRSRIISALIYPALLAGVGGAVCLFLIGYVVPRFATVYRGSRGELPWLSAQLMTLGEFIAAHRLPLLGLALAGGVLAFSALRSGVASGQIEQLLAALPGLGRRVRLFRLSQLYLTLGTLLNSGLPALQALGLVQRVLPPQLAISLLGVSQMLQAGQPLSEALARHQLATPVSLRLLHAGEGTGRLGEMLIRTARYHDNEIGRWLERFSRLFEPLLMAAIGLLVGAIVVLLYLPIFDLAGSLQ